MTFTRKQFQQITTVVSKYVKTLRNEKRITICCWETSDGVRIADNWPNWKNGFQGRTSITSCCYDSPIDNVVSRIMTGLENN